ncbi:MAG: hypothetical protein R3F54_26835 [Alphaproteobacteria bacterium]
MIGLTISFVYHLTAESSSDQSAFLAMGELALLILFAIAVAFVVPMLLTLRRQSLQRPKIFRPRKVSSPKPARPRSAHSRN